MLCGEIECSCAMVENYLSAIKANLILFDLPFAALFCCAENKRTSYFESA